MPNLAGRAVLFVDVDGPLIPFGDQPPDGSSGTRHTIPASVWMRFGNPLLSRLDPRDGERLLGLGCDLVWATSWMTEANEVIAPLIGLPDLPVVTWSDMDDSGQGSRHWKTADVVSWAAGRRFVWIDDEITDTDATWVAAHHHGLALLHRIDPRYGLTSADFAVISEWLTSTQ